MSKLTTIYSFYSIWHTIVDKRQKLSLWLKNYQLAKNIDITQISSTQCKNSRFGTKIVNSTQICQFVIKVVDSTQNYHFDTEIDRLIYSLIDRTLNFGNDAKFSIEDIIDKVTIIFIVRKNLRFSIKILICVKHIC